MTALTVLIAHDYLTYRETLAAALLSLRPDIQVELCEERDLDAAVRLHTPQVVICGHRGAAVGRHAPSWVVLYPGDGTPDLDLHDVLRVLDQALADLGSRSRAGVTAPPPN